MLVTTPAGTVFVLDAAAFAEIATPPALPGPALPAEVYNTTPFDPIKAWAATVALSQGA